MLPFKKGRLPRRGSIKSMPTRPATCVHEFLHSIERQVAIPLVHGPRGNWLQVFHENNIRSGTDWNIHLIRSVKDWRKTKYLRH